MHRFATGFLLGYGILVLMVHVSIDYFLDLYTFTDSGTVALVAGVAVLPLAVYTLFRLLPILEWPWYGNVLISFAIGGFYVLSAYFTVKKLDLLWSVATRPGTEQQWPIGAVEKVFAGRAGFVHTQVTLRMNQKPIPLEASRSSYFWLKNRKTIRGKVSISGLNEYVIRELDVSANERWQARGAYGQDWFQRYRWLGILLVLYVIWQVLKDRFFSKTP
ncbi:hypothetical protein [Siphonobacter sp.]|uniref:hypothetical protein n=1 Tax=Siphonobacter sp. TaxID=1869184 RepID=UPI003B3BC3C4